MVHEKRVFTQGAMSLLVFEPNEQFVEVCTNMHFRTICFESSTHSIVKCGIGVGYIRAVYPAAT